MNYINKLEDYCIPSLFIKLPKFDASKRCIFISDEEVDQIKSFVEKTKCYCDKDPGDQFTGNCN